MFFALQHALDSFRGVPVGLGAIVLVIGFEPPSPYERGNNLQVQPVSDVDAAWQQLIGML
jgi:hypothetical protein